MEKQQVLTTLKALLETEFLEGASKELDETTPLLGLGVFDSFALLRLLSLIESKFHVKIPLETLTLDRIKDMDSISTLIIELTQDQM